MGISTYAYLHVNTNEDTGRKYCTVEDKHARINIQTKGTPTENQTDNNKTDRQETEADKRT